MEIKDNGLDFKTETEQTALPNGSAVAREKEECGSAVFRKFKDANALAQAYGALEAEFTRRSQRLKELERLLAKGAEEAQDDFVAKEKGGETPEQTSQASADCSNGEIDAVQPERELGHGKMVDDKTVGSEKTNDCVVVGYEQGFGEGTSSDGEKSNMSVVAPSAESVVQELSDDDVYRIATKNDSVRMKIVGDYLASLKNAGAPLARGGVGAVASPPSKPHSVADAGNMALQFFRVATKS